MFGRTRCPDRVGLRWCSGIESVVIQNHRHCSPVPPCSASYSSLQSRLHAHRARQSSFPANRKCSNNNSKNTFLYSAFTKLNTPKVLLPQCPLPANHVSCRMMLILAFSLLSSLFMTALFLVSLMPWRSSESPNIRVRMFQHPSSRAGLFCRIFLLLSGAIVYNLQFGCLLVSMHPMKKADCGGTTLSFSGLISLGYKPLTFIMYPS